MTLPPTGAELVERFRCDLERLVGAAPGTLGVAVSGGPDSLALLLLAAAAFPGAVQAATVDHRLRPESGAEAAFVAGICAGLGIPHAILTADEPVEGNLQSAGRALRYRLLAHWAAETGIAWVLTAHHADDQAETLIMRLGRGAGLSGLAGIRAATRIAGLAVARPLLGWRRHVLAGIVRAAGLEPVSDPGNSDDRFDRARLRKRLQTADWLDPARFARSAEALAEAEAALDWTVARLMDERTGQQPEGFSLDPAGLPLELCRRLVLRILAALAPAEPPRGEALQRLLATLEAGGTATLAGVKCSGGPRWRFTPAPPRRAR
jgi:tRNA(Ile)-lysidine synthase